MNSLAKYILLSFASLLLLTSCNDELKVGGDYQGDAWVTLRFGAEELEKITVNSRATLGVVPESRVMNLFVYVFYTAEGGGAGRKIYANFFDNSNKFGSELEVLQQRTDPGWYVENTTDETEHTLTWGVLRMRMPKVNGARIYVVANIDADMVNISPEKLNVIRSESELQDLIVRLNQQIVSRNGYFPMSAKLENVNITDAGILVGGDNYSTRAKPLSLERLDAKISVNIGVATEFTKVIDAQVNGETVTSIYKAKEFVPESWRVVNVPRSTTLFPTTNPSSTNKDDYFATHISTMEEQKSLSMTIDSDNYVDPKASGFSFYMMENKASAYRNKEITGTYNGASGVQLRALKRKNADGTFPEDTDEYGLWEYAPKTATYLEIKGELKMSVDVSNEAKTQQLGAVVTYYVLLGDFGTSPDNYDIERNTHYTYNILITGVNSIETEVTTSKSGTFTERNPGAEGQVYIAKQTTFTFDAHFAQRVFSFDAAYIDPNTVTWYVNTPFGVEGTPIKVGDTEIPTGLDYKWVKFKINRDTDRQPNGDPYTDIHCNRWYPGDNSSELMDVVQFTKYIKDQKRLLDLNDPIRPSEFRLEEDADWKAKFPTSPNLYMRNRLYATVYIDEYYYDAHPINGTTPVDLWKQFVNKPNRMMHILCDNQKSTDGASSATGSVITIRQRSIQTPYAVNKDDLLTAWGTETEDELSESHYLFFSPNEQLKILDDGNYHVTGYTPTAVQNECKQLYNGLYNTCCLLQFLSGGNWVNPRWDTYLDFNKPNDESTDNQLIKFMKDDYKALLYGVLTRNRDSNGNGIIDPEEIRWYVGAKGQYYGLYIGGEGLNSDAWLYPRRYSLQPNERLTADEGGQIVGAYKCRVRMVSSTYRNSKGPSTLWAEEGISDGYYDNTYDRPGIYAIRCMRNLGINNLTKDNIIASAASDVNAYVPQHLIVHTKEGTGADAVYKFDLTNINDASKRYYTTRELEPRSENSEEARCYQGFVTGQIISSQTLVNKGIRAGEKDGYDDLKAMLDRGESPCNDGYRVPNVREGALMSIYCSETGWWSSGETRVSNYYSLYKYEENGSGAWSKRRSWEFKYQNAALEGGNNLHIREVRDWQP